MRSVVRGAISMFLWLVVAGISLPALAAPAAEAKAGSGLENRELTGEGAEFGAGSTVYVWSRVTGAKDTKVKHVWKKDGKEFFTATFTVGSQSWRVNSRRKASAGSYVVEVVAEDGTKLSEVSFTVK
jgi:hypothetical protein